MKITIFGSAGMVGERLVCQALAKGFYVTAFDRQIEGLIDKDNRDVQLNAVKGYVFDSKEVFNVLKNTDAVLSVMNGSLHSSDKTRSLGMKNIISQMEKNRVKRIIVLGSIGIMNADKDHYMLDMPDYPKEWEHIGKEDMLAFQALEKSSLDWTMVCPHTLLDEEGNGQYTTSNTYPPGDGNRTIAAGDIADFMLTEIVSNLHLHQRVGIGASKFE